MIQIRPATFSDADGVAAIYAPIVRDTVISFELEPPSADEMRARMETTLARYPWLVCQHDSDVIGYAYAGAFRARAAYRWTAETTVYIRADARGIGVGAALYDALLGCLRIQGIIRVVGGITLPNAASVALHERAGFQKVGEFQEVGYKQDAWHDVGFWQRRISDADRPAHEPIAWPDVAATDEIRRVLEEVAARIRGA